MNAYTRTLIIVAALTPVTACAFGGQNAGTPLANTARSDAAHLRTRAGDSGTASPAPSPAATPAVFAFLKFGGYSGQHFEQRKSGQNFEYSETVAVEFTQPLATKTFSYTISPQTPSSVYFGNDYVRAATITVRKVPGVVYTLTIPAGIADQAGDVLTSPITETFTTPKTPRPEKPKYSTLDQPYRYGVLEHPFPDSLAGSNVQQQVATIAAAGARFARIDYCGAQSEPASEGTYDFSIEDAIMDQLAAQGMTELPIIEQYCSPSWANGGSTDGAPLWSTPAQYAEFAGAVAAHVAMKYPQITRMELFNEPNLASFWDAPARYSDTSGGAAATYMMAAYAAIKAAAPAMTVVGPALSDGGTGVVDPRTFLSNMYAAGCKTGVCWDVLSVHNYAWMNPTFASEPDLPKSYFNRFDIYKDLQTIATSDGESAKPHVMLTEWGYSTDPTSPSGFDPAVQAAYISVGLNKLAADASVDGVVYTNIHNPASDFFAEMTLTDSNFNPSPGYAVYKSFASH